MKLNFEYLFLIAFISVFLATGLGVFDQKLTHQFPMGYFASDSFFHQAETQWMADQGVIKYALPSMEGGRKDVYDAHPPFLFALTSFFSYASGLEVHDAIYFLVILMLMLIALTIYAITRRFNRNVAMLSIPITLLVFTHPFNLAINFGQWLFIAGSLFMVASFWAISRLEENKMYLLLALFLSATAIAHQPELLFAGMVLGIYIAARWITQKHHISKLIPLLICTAIVIALSAYSLNIFRLTWLTTYFTEDAKLGFTTETQIEGKGFADISLQSIGISTQISPLTILGLLIVAGIAISILMITQKKTGLWPAWIAFFMLTISFLTFFGLAKRAFAHRWLWHFYFAFFFGLAIYYALKTVIKNWNPAYSAGLAIIILMIAAAPAYGKAHGSLMDKNNWDALKWASQNTPENSSMHVFDIGRLQQSATLYNSRRVSYIIHPNAYSRAFQAQPQNITRLEDLRIADTYEFGLASAYSHLLCDRNGFLSYGYYHTYLPSEDPECHNDFKEPTSPPRDTKLCNMEYYYINTGENSQYAIYNQALAAKLQKKGWIKKVYSNPSIIILKNERPGDECLD